jgi:catechol 2,3-dioxygenase-like lactoylglutathione lyase family enzyme
VLLTIDHVQLAMPSGGESLARSFYIGVLGMREVPKPSNLANRDGCWFVSGDVRVHLGVEPGFQPAKKAHPAFLVTSLQKALRVLEASAVAVTRDEAIDGFDRIYCSDPFGNRIELMQQIR